VTVIKLPGRNEKAHTLESAEIVACLLDGLALFEFMFCVAHAGRPKATTAGNRHVVRNADLIVPVISDLQVSAT
jgi:hypothetical protein